MSRQTPARGDLACSQCGRMFAQSDLVQVAGNWVCGNCKPAFLSRVMAGDAGVSPLGWRYGGFWIRFGARIIDGLVMGVPLLILFAALIPNLMRVGNQSSLNPAIAAFTLSFLLVYFLILTSYEVLLLRYQGATLGKMACGLKVVRSDGRGLGWGVSFGRFFMWNVLTSVPYLNMIFMLISGIMAGVDEQKRALHDRVCDTRVIYKRATA